MNGKLYLIPTFLGDLSKSQIPEYNLSVICGLDTFIAEREKTARAFLKACETPVAQDDLQFFPMDKRTTEDDFETYLEPCLSGKNIGLMSEAGLPCVADPGAKVVNLAHALGIEVVPLSGMSSIMLTLMASGFNGQNFRFHGYLPHDKNQKTRKIREMEKDVAKGETQIFIETPYRNNQLISDLIKNGHPETSLCIGIDLMTSVQMIKMMPLNQWKKSNIDLNKRLAVFAIGKRQ